MKNVVVSGSFSKVPPGQVVGVVDLEQMEAAAAAALPPGRGRDRPRGRPPGRGRGRGRGRGDGVGDDIGDGLRDGIGDGEEDSV